MRTASNYIRSVNIQSKSIMSIFSLMRSICRLPIMVGPIGQLAFPLAFKFPDNQIFGCILGLLCLGPGIQLKHLGFGIFSRSFPGAIYARSQVPSLCVCVKQNNRGIIFSCQQPLNNHRKNIANILNVYRLIQSGKKNFRNLEKNSLFEQLIYLDGFSL